MNNSGNILVGQYSARDSFMHRLDSRGKMVIAVLIMTCTLITKAVVAYAGILLLLGLSLYSSNLSLVELRRNLRPLVTLIIITMLLHLLFVSHTPPYIIQFWSVSISQAVVSQAVLYSIRLVIFVLLSLALMATTSPSEIAEATTSLLRPLERIKVPVGRVSMILFLAMRFIPILYREFESIKNAQIIRGVSFKGTLYQRIKSHTALLLPLLFAAIKRADDLAIAMTVRGYDPAVRRSNYTHASFGMRDTLSVALGSTYLILLVVIGSEIG